MAPPLGQLQRQSCSLFNWPALKGVLHKAAESTAGVCVSGVRAKFSKSSQCVSQWQHMLESLQRNARMHNLTCKQADGRCAFFYRHKTTVQQSVCDVLQCTCKTCVDLSICLSLIRHGSSKENKCLFPTSWNVIYLRYAHTVVVKFWLVSQETSRTVRGAGDGRDRLPLKPVSESVNW